MMEAASTAVGEAGKRRKRSWGGGGGPGAGLVLGFGRGGGKRDGVFMDGFSISPASATAPVLWNSRRRPSANAQRSGKVTDADGIKSHVSTPGSDDSVRKTGSNDDTSNRNSASTAVSPVDVDDAPAPMEADTNPLELMISERRKALFEPLNPNEGPRARRIPAEELLPPPDFDSVAYPKGWLVGKKRKLVNVDVVESMRRIAVLEMNRKDREIDGLNEQLEEDARCLEQLQLQLLEERSRRANVERENAVLKNQVALLTDMLQEAEEHRAVDGEEEDEIGEHDGGYDRPS